MSELENKMEAAMMSASEQVKEEVNNSTPQPEVVKEEVKEEVAETKTEETQEKVVEAPQTTVEVKEEVNNSTPQPEVVKEEVKEEVVAETKTEETPTNTGDYKAYVSDTFHDLVKDMDAIEDAKKMNSKDILKSIQVDLSSIEIIKDPGIFQMNEIEEMVLTDKSTMMVTCCQSSYTAEISALKSQEIQAISNSDVDYYSYKKKLFQTINKHIENTSVGKIDYGKWLHVTSYFDIDTLLYGLYCQTFNYQNKYAINCPKCGHTFDAIVNNNTLVELRGRDEGAETFEKIQEIVSSVKNADELVEKSHVHKTKRIILEESKIIVDIRIPSAYDYLEEVVAKADNSALEDYQNAIGIALFVEAIYLPNLLLFNQTGELKYVKVEGGKSRLLSTISNLGYYDSLQLTDEINDYVDKYRVTYSIRNITCPSCGYIIKNIPMDMEEVLFNTIRLGRNGK